jgi:hypothetical protein
LILKIPKKIEFRIWNRFLDFLNFRISDFLDFRIWFGVLNFPSKSNPETHFFGNRTSDFRLDKIKKKEINYYFAKEPKDQAL